MTNDEIASLARFLDTAGDFLKDGHARNHEQPDFGETNTVSAVGDFSSLPLAYQVEEDEVTNAGATAAGVPSLTQDEISAAINNCKACGLCETRNKTAPGEGAPDPLVMVVGEGPGADEDAAGRPFVGKAGQLLDKMLASIGLFREKNCYIANIVKCRPPENRDPSPDEIAACLPFLEQQIRLLRPRILLCAGRIAAQNLLKSGKGIGSLRGDFSAYESIPVLCTYHPSAVLRDESLKKPVWEDLKLIRAKLLSLNGEYAAGMKVNEG